MTIAQLIAEPAEPRIVDNCYVLFDRLGEGGMGTVYRAVNRLNAQTIALKLVDTNQLGAEPRMALMREFQTLASLHHPNIVEVLSYGIDANREPYFTMELLEQPQTILEAAFGKSIDDKVHLFAQLLRALTYVHRRGILHRDLKPSNVLCMGDQVKLLDFGIAVQKSHVMELAGTVEYMAPELLLGRPPSVASDLYAAGIMGFQMLTGLYPYKRNSMTSMISGILGTDTDITLGKNIVNLLDNYLVSESATAPASADEPVEDEPEDWMSAPELNSPLGEIVRRMLARTPEERYTDANTVLEELRDKLGSHITIETAETRESFLQASDLVGRQTELAQLTTALDLAATGKGSSWLLGGEGGVGKSRLLVELRTQALVMGTSVLMGQAVAEGGNHYQLWIPALRVLCLQVPPKDHEAAILKELISDLGTLLGRPLPAAPAVQVEMVQQRLFLTIEALFRRSTKPVVVLLEDLHWAGPDSITLLNRLSGLARQLPLLVIATYRDDEFPDLPLRLPQMQIQRLRRLDQSSVADLAVSMLGEAGKQPWLVDYLCRQTEGNVFFLVEVVRALAEQLGQLSSITTASALPEQIVTVEMERIVDRRMERLPAAYRTVLEAAAILGRKFDLKILQQMFPAIEIRTWLTLCANSALLETQDGEWRFAHDKLREGILGRIAVPQRLRSHAEVAQVMRALYPDSESSYPALAYHYNHAEMYDEAGTYYFRAGNGATRLCAYAEARRHFGFSLGALQKLPPTSANKRRIIDVLLCLVRTSQTAEQPEVNLGRLRQATTLLTEVAAEGGETDWLRQAWIAYWLGRLHYYRNQLRESLQYCEQVLRIAKQHGHNELLTLANSASGTALSSQGRVGPALLRLLPTIETYAAINHEYEWVRAVGNSGLCLVGLGQYQRGMEELNRAHVRAVAIGQPIIISMTHLYNSMGNATSGDWPLTLAEGNKALDLATQQGEKIYMSLAQKHIAWAESQLGRYDDAFENYRKSEETVQRMGGRLLWSDLFDAVYAELLGAAGRHAEAIEHAERVVLESYNSDNVNSRGIAERAWAAALHHSGQGTPAEVDRHLGLSLQAFLSSELVLDAAHTHLVAARICRDRGETEAAQAQLDSALTQFIASGCSYALSRAQETFK